MSKSKFFTFASIFFAVGVFTESIFMFPALWLYMALGIVVVFFGILFISKHKIGYMLLLFCAVMLLGMFRVSFENLPNQFENIFETKVNFEALVVEDIDVRQDKQLVTVLPEGFKQRILVILPLSQKYFYGDSVFMSGKISEVKNFDDFDYKKYLERFDTYAVMRYPQFLVLKSHKGIFLKEQLLKLKYAFVGRLSAVFSEPQGSLLLGMLIGAKKSLPADVLENFNMTGTSHIIALSGFNITIIISSLSFLAYLLGRKWAFWVSLIIIMGFVVLSGASASVIRAAVMGSLLLVSKNIGRQYSVVPALFFSAFIMLVINPKILYWDIGFQLSFAATLGIVYFVPLLEELTDHWVNPFEIKSIFLVTMSAILSTFPLILLYFGTLSLVAPVVNMLILPLLPLTTLLGFLSILPWIGVGFAFVADKFLIYILWITKVFAHITFSSLSIKISHVVFLVLVGLIVYAYFFLLLLKYKKGKVRT